MQCQSTATPAQKTMTTVRSRQSAVERRPSTVSSNICRSVSQVVWAQENQKSSNTTIRRSGDRVNVLKSKLARAKLEGQKRHEKRLQLQTQRKLRLHMESDWDCARVAINIIYFYTGCYVVFGYLAV